MKMNQSDYEDPSKRRERIALVRAKAKHLEEEVQRKELMIKCGKKIRVEDVFNANEMLIDAIESKLSLLHNINGSD